MKAWLLILVLAVLLVVGSVIEVRVLVLPFSVPVLLSVPLWFHSLTPAPQFLVWCCVERRGAPGCWELGAVVDGVGGVGVDRLLLLLVPRLCVLARVLFLCKSSAEPLWLCAASQA